MHYIINHLQKLRASLSHWHIM